MYKSQRSQETDISKKVKDVVWDRDEHMCIFCGSPYAHPEAHVIPRSKGGLGIEQNIITVCRRCHNLLDQSSKREKMQKQAQKYLERIYGEIRKEDVTYSAKAK